MLQLNISLKDLGVRFKGLYSQNMAESMFSLVYHNLTISITVIWDHMHTASSFNNSYQGTPLESATLM